MHSLGRAVRHYQVSLVPHPGFCAWVGGTFVLVCYDEAFSAGDTGFAPSGCRRFNRLYRNLRGIHHAGTEHVRQVEYHALVELGLVLCRSQRTGCC